MKKQKNLFFICNGKTFEKNWKQFSIFPIDNWQNELDLAKKLNFNGVEWIISDFSNPIFNNEFLRIIKNLTKNKMAISSVSMDLIMDKSLYEISNLDLGWLIKNYFFTKKI